VIPYQEQEEEAVIIHADRYVHEKVTNFEEEGKKKIPRKNNWGRWPNDDQSPSSSLNSYRPFSAF